MKDSTGLDLADPRLWDHEPKMEQRWRKQLRVVIPIEDWTSEQQRDAAWGAAHGWKFTYYPDGHKEATIPDGRVVRFPVSA